MSNFYGSYIGFGAGTTGGATGNFYQATNYGYAMGGGPGPYDARVQKYSLTAGTDATNVGDMTQDMAFCRGVSSATYGFRCGGGYPLTNVIDKTSFAADGICEDIGNLQASTSDSCCSSAEAYGFSATGYPQTDRIDKIDFSSDGDATDHGNISSTRYGASGHGSLTHGYATGGHPVGTQRDKYAHSSNVTSVDDGDMTAGKQNYGDACSSQEYGYTLGGSDPGGGYSSVIDKYAFASGGTASAVSTTVYAGQAALSTLSTPAYGYRAAAGTPGMSNMIERWDFASDGDSVDTDANMMAARAYGASVQY